MTLYSVTITYAIPPLSPYEIGETLDPSCAPGDTNCSVENLPINSDGVSINKNNNPTIIDTLGTDSGPVKLFIAGHYAYVISSTTKSLQVIDITDPDSLTISSTLDLSAYGTPHSIYVSGKYAYIGNEYFTNAYRILVIDISKSSAPTVVATNVGGDSSQYIYGSGKYMYTVENDGSISVGDPFAYSTGSDLAFRSSTGAGSRDVFFLDGYMYLANYTGGNLEIVDAHVLQENNLSSVSTTSTGFSPTSVFVSGKYAYVTDYTSGGGALRVIDISDPTSPSITGSVSISEPVSVYVSGRYAYVTDTLNNQVHIVDVFNPASPTIVGSVTTDSYPASVSVSGKYAYVVNRDSNTFQSIDLGGSEFSSSKIHSLESGSLNVKNDAKIGQNLDVKGSISSGFGFKTEGPIETLDRLNAHRVIVDNRAKTTGSTVVVTNGDITGSATGWTLGADASYGSNKITSTYSTGDVSFYTGFNVEANKSYLVTFTVSGATNTLVDIYFDNSTYYPGIAFPNGTYKILIDNDSNFTGVDNIYFDMRTPAAGASFAIDGITILEITNDNPNTLFERQSLTSYGFDGRLNLLTDDERGNVALGSSVLHNGYNNTSVGTYALTNTTNSGQNNAAFGVSSLISVTSGQNNAAFGANSGSLLTTGGTNSIFGSSTLKNLTTGSNNVAIGYNTGAGITTGSGNTIIGTGVTSLSTSLTNNIILASGSTTRAQFDGTSWSFVGPINNLASTSSQPTSVGSVATNTSACGLVVEGRYAYVTNNTSNTLQAFDISNPSSPSLLGSVAAGSQVCGIAVAGQYAYVTNYNASTLQVFDISNPSSLTSVGSVATGSNPRSPFISGRYVYIVTAAGNTLQIFDISNPVSPVSVGSVATGSGPQQVHVSGRYAYVVNFTPNTLQIIDISNPASPTSVGSVSTGAGAKSVYVSGRYAYVLNSTANTLQIFNVSNPASPVSVGSVATGSNPQQIYVSGGYAYVTNFVSNTLQIFNVSNPASPVSVGSVSTGSGPYGVVVSGRYAYVTNFTANTLQIFSIVGGEFTSATAHSLEAGNLQVRNDILAQGVLQVTGGISAGLGGISSLGPMSIYTNSTTNNVFSITANSLTTGTGLNVSHTTSVVASGGSLMRLSSTSNDTSTTTGALLDLSSTTSTAGTQFLQTYSGLTTGIGQSIVTNALTTGTAFRIPHTTSVIASGGSLMRLSSTSVDTSTTTGVLLDLSSTASTAGTQFLQTYSGLTTGIGQSIAINALTTGTGLSISHTTSVIADGGSLLKLSSTSADTGGATTGTLLNLSGNGTTTGTLSRIASSTLTTGKLLDLQVSGTAAAASQTALNILTTGANGTAGITTYGAQISNTHSTNTSTNVALFLNASGGATANYGLIVNAGNVGLGQTAPGFQLHVGSSAVTDGTTLIRLQDTNSTCDFNANAGGPTCGSDLTLKKDIESLDIEDLFMRVSALNPVSYRWVDDGESAPMQYGFIAQEVEVQFPNLVTENIWIDGSTRKFLNMSGLMPYIVGAIKGIDFKITNISDLTLENTWRDSLIAWFGNIENGITKIFAGEVETKTLCISDDTGEKTCITKSQLDALIGGSGSTNNNSTPADETPTQETSGSSNPVVEEVPTEEVPPVEETIPVEDPAPTDAEPI